MTSHFRGKRVLVTGHTGFKGGWLTVWLHSLGARVAGLALDPATTPSLYALAGVHELVEPDLRVDVRDRAATTRAIESIGPDVVFHLAAQPLVRASYDLPIETFETNVIGTLHVLDAVQRLGTPCAVVVVTTDKVYANDERGVAFRETDPLGGHDPYSASKACAEIATESWRASFGAGSRVRIATARAGNVIGGGDWSPDRLMVDILRSLERGRPIVLRNPSSTRPWQHVVEPLAGYLMLAERLAGDRGDRFAKAWNFGPPSDGVCDVRSVARFAVSAWGGGEIVEAPDGGPHEARTLALSVERARSELGWSGRWNVEQSVRRAMAWYKAQRSGEDARALALADIDAHTAEATPKD